MLKKLLILFIAIAPVAVVAQQIAVVNSHEIFAAMPELSDIERQIADRAEEMQRVMQELETEYNRRLAEFQALPETASETIRQDRQREVMQVIERHQTFMQNSHQELQQLEFTLLEPVQRRIMEAIEAVGREGGYAFVLERGSFVFVNDNAPNITQRVKARLGIR